MIEVLQIKKNSSSKRKVSFFDVGGILFALVIIYKIIENIS